MKENAQAFYLPLKIFTARILSKTIPVKKKTRGKLQIQSGKGLQQRLASRRGELNKNRVNTCLEFISLCIVHSFLGTQISGSIFQKFLRLALKPIRPPWLNNIDDCSVCARPELRQ